MKTKKEYPATHSMWTAWFAIDKDGNVAIMECADDGPAPIGLYIDQSADELLLNTLISDDSHIDYTDDQLIGLMRHSITPMEYMDIQTERDSDFEYIFDAFCEIDPRKIDLLREAASMSESNKLKCISPGLNLWYLDFTPPYYKDNSGDIRYRPTKAKEEANKRSKELNKRLFEEGAIKRIVTLYWALNEDCEGEGTIKHADSPLNLYFQDYGALEPSERMITIPDHLQVKETQLPEQIKSSAIRLPISFKDSETIQLAEHVGVYFRSSEWIVDGQDASVVKMTDGTPWFVGDNCVFKPIPIDEAFNTHDVKYRYGSEYKINGIRGYRKYDDKYYRAGSREGITPTKDDTIELVGDDKD